MQSKTAQQGADWKRNALVAVLVGAILEWWKAFPASKFVWHLLTIAWQWAGATVPLPRWLALLVSTAAVTSLFFLARQAIRSRRLASDRQSYRMADFLGVKWNWGYFSNSTAIANLTPLCPVCGLELDRAPSDRSRVNGSRLKCLECDFDIQFEVNLNAVTEHVEKLIQRQVRFKAYPGGGGQLPIPSAQARGGLSEEG